MKKNKELIKNTIIIMLGKLCTQFITFLLLPLYTFVLTTNEYGIVDLIITYVSLLVPLVTLQLESAIFRFLIDNRENEKNKSIIITSSIFSVIFQFLFCLIIFFIVTIFIDVTYKYYLILMIFSTMISNIFLQISRGLGDNITFSYSSVLTGITTVLCNILFLVVFKFGIVGMLISHIIANMLCAAYIFKKINIYKYIKSKFFSRKEVMRLLKYSLPLVPNGLIWWIINVSDRTIVTFVLGAGANGLYAVSNKFSNIVIQFYNSFNLSWTESASLHINDKDKDSFFSNTFMKVLEFSYTIVILILAFMPVLFKILINEKYIEAYKYIPILLISMIFNIIVSFLGAVYIAKKLTKEVAKTSLYAGILNIIFNILFIKKIRLYAAAISTLLAFFFMSVYRLFDVQKYVKIKIEWKKVVLMTIVLSLQIYIYFANNLLIIIGMIFSSIFGILINKDILIYIINSLKKIIKK